MLRAIPAFAFALNAFTSILITGLLCTPMAGAANASLDAPKSKKVSSDKGSYAKEKNQTRRVFKSVDEVINIYGASVRNKLKPILNAANVAYPPAQMTWVCLKQEKVLLLFARDREGKQKQVLGYPIIGASGVAGPKLKEGDLQVPEGFYKIPSFHPNVIAHMALDVNYPNDEDRAHAKSERRKSLGCDILIHGSRWSTGCLAMGDKPIEEMFVLAYDCGIKNVRLIFAPCNLTVQQPKIDYKKQPNWLPALYERISTELKKYPIDVSVVPPPPVFLDTKGEKK